jgi:hypothetical protein
MSVDSESAVALLRVDLQNASSPSPHTANDNGSVHRAAANKLNNETRATRGSVCNALLSRLAAKRRGINVPTIVSRRQSSSISENALQLVLFVPLSFRAFQDHVSDRPK